MGWIPKGWSYKEIPFKDLESQKNELTRQGWERYAIQEGIVYLKRHSEGEWDGLPPDSGMW